MVSQIAFQANLVRKDDLKTSSNGNSYLRLSVSKNYSQKVNEEYQNVPIFENITLFGKQAEAFEMSDIPLGSPLLIVGNLQGRVQPSYTDKNGNVVPESNVEQIFVTEIGALIGQGRKVNVSSIGENKTEKETTKKTSKQKKETVEDDFDDIFK